MVIFLIYNQGIIIRYFILNFTLLELLIRQKTKLFVFCNNFDSELLLNNYSIYDNCDIPLADADITANHFCTADVKHFVKLWKDG